MVDYLEYKIFNSIVDYNYYQNLTIKNLILIIIEFNILLKRFLNIVIIIRFNNDIVVYY